MSKLHHRLLTSSLAAVAAASVLLPMSTASATVREGLIILPPECNWGPGSVVTCTYDIANSTLTPSYSLFIPSGSSNLHIEASGAAGGKVLGTQSTYSGGKGARVTASYGATLNNEGLTIVVGQSGGDGSSACCTAVPGGYPDGGTGGQAAVTRGASGGGSSKVSLNGTPLVIAGAGGGAGYGNDSSGQTVRGGGGVGGAAGQNGGTGGHAGQIAPGSYLARGGAFGPAATGSTPGGGSNGGTYNTTHCGIGSANGFPGFGGSGSTGGASSYNTATNVSAGGGGGGGYAGGGAGAMAAHCVENSIHYYGGGGGGGGGSSYSSDAGATTLQGAQAPETADGKVVITYLLPDGVAPSISVSHAPNGTNGFNTASPVALAVNASDSDSGLAGTPTCTDNGNSISVTGSVPNFSASVSGDGTHSIVCTATDDADNQAQATDTVKIDSAAPTVTVSNQGDGSLSPFAIDFSEPVLITPDNSVQFIEDENAQNLPGALTCTSGFDGQNRCKSWAFTPSQPTTPNDVYDAFFQQQDGAFIDRAGNQMAQTFQAVRGTGVVMFDDPAVGYRWAVKTLNGAIGDAVTREREAGASAAYSFSGTKFTWYTVKGPDQGVAHVTITDPNSPVDKNINNYSATIQKQAKRVFKGLSRGQHTVTITVSGETGDPSATDQFVSIDAFAIGKQAPFDNPTAQYQWRNDVDFAWTTQPKARAIFTFRGTSFSWGAAYGPNSGQARVLIDGQDMGVVDLYAASGSFNFTLYTGLTDQLHTVQVVSLATKNPASTGHLVSVRRFTAF